MATVSLSPEELLLLQETCIEGELRCEQRASAAMARRDYAAAAQEIEIKARYTGIKRRMLQELIPPPAGFQDLPGAPAWLRDGIRDGMAVAGS